MRTVIAFLLCCLGMLVRSQVTVDPMGPTSLCGSPTLNVPFTATGSYNAGNVFTAELSDATGSFAAPTVIGSLAGTASGSIACDFPAGMSGGYALRINASDPLETGAPYVLPLVTVVPPNAGNNATVTYCSTEAPQSIFALLGVDAMAGGSWTDPAGGIVSDLFVPGSGIPGCYTYNVAGNAPCAADVATVCVTVNEAAAAGTDASITICSSAAPLGLFTFLGGSPQAGGSWAFAGGANPGIYMPGSSVPGCYVYTVNGASPCTDASAMVCITEIPMPDAGMDATIAVCSSDAPVDLNAELVGTPGGTWSGALAASNGVYDPATMDPGSYQYEVMAVGCSPDLAVVTVLEVNAANAGGDVSFTVCDQAAPFTLFSALLGTPQAGGSWLDPMLLPTSGIFSPATSAPGCYRYIVQGMPPCINDSATACVTVQTAPNAGTGSTVAWCQSFGNLDLFAQLSGGPDAGGTWTDDNATGALTGSTFAAGAVPPGSYGFTYVVNAPGCSPASATVTVNVGPCLAPPGGIFPNE